MWLIMTFLACGDKETSQDSSEPSVEDTGWINGIPNAPEPFSMTLTGAQSETLSFDYPTCQIPGYVPNLNAFWRSQSSSHKFVLRVVLRDDFVGDGTYAIGTHQLQITLQEEAGGQGRYYQVDASQGDSGSITVTTHEDGYVWGRISASTMHGNDGTIYLSPAEFPIWCTPDNTN